MVVASADNATAVGLIVGEGVQVTPESLER
jgi:hypothetical protein